MILHVNPNDELPIYRQLVRQIRHAIATGGMQPGKKLPSQREVALGLIINHLTVKKAYETLEAEGVIHTLRGRGTFVADPLPASLFKNSQKKLKQDIAEVVKTAKLLDFNEADLLALVEIAWNKK